MALPSSVALLIASSRSMDDPIGRTSNSQDGWRRLTSSGRSTSIKKDQRMAISKKASIRTTSPEREAAGKQAAARSAQRQAGEDKARPAHLTKAMVVTRAERVKKGGA
jgi:hypothetical protein